MFWTWSATQLTTLFFLTSTHRVNTLYRAPPSLADYTNGQVTFTLVTNKLQYDQALQVCADLLGGTLARIDSEEANQAIREFSITTWESAGWGDEWIGLHWRSKQTNGPRSLLWSDNCQDFDTSRYHDFKSGDDTLGATEFCYRIKPGFEWEVKTCAEKNSFICETRSSP
ncbi:hypothetical protein ElyMa_001428900, partial [Elysia marginata]